MRLPHGKKTRRKNSRNSNSLGYDNLEAKNLLTTLVSFNASTQNLGINLTATNDVAVVDVATNGNITVNGSQDLNSNADGVQAIAASSLNSITVVGNAGTNQQLTLNGNYSNAAGRSIQSVQASGIRSFTVNGNYQLGGNLSVTLDEAGGQVGQGAASLLQVGGSTTINANSNSVTLLNANNDFVGDVNVTTSVGDIELADANNISFSNVSTTGDFTVNAGGNIVDSVGSSIAVTGITRFDGGNVVLGDNTGDLVNFSAISSATTQDFILTEDSATTLLNVSARNLTINSSAGIFDGRRTDIVVSDQATFNAGTAIRIGENGTDTFNAGSVNFNATGHVHISENTGIIFTGSNTANSITVISEGNIGDTATSAINIADIAHFDGANITLGDTATDQYNSGSLEFVTPGDLNLTENSDTHIIETKNQAQRLFLTSEGAITDAADAQTTVELFSQFTAESVSLGDSETDLFNAGSIGFNTTNAFNISEDSATNIIGFNSANSSNIVSTGAITNIFTGANGDGTNIDVASVASFEGASIDLGEQANDSLNFGALQLNSPGVATVSEDSATHLTQSSQVQSLNLTSVGAVTDALTASINVTGVANVEGTTIRWGENAGDEVNAGSFTLNSGGAVEITEDSSLNLTGINTADSLTLVASGNITDSLNAQTRVTNLLSATGNLVNLGSESTDVLEMGQLEFNSTANTFITADSGFTITGTNRAGNLLILDSQGSITDSLIAEIIAENGATFTGADVIIGELATDCFDILNGVGPAVITQGTSNVVLGGC